MIGRTLGVPALAALALVLLPVGCGEREFDAPSLIEELNDEGAGLVLERPLSSGEDGPEVHAVSFAEDADGHADEEGDGHEHGGGAVVILGDADRARDELARCRGAISFTCFRAANAVLRFEGIEASEQQRLERALLELGTDD